MKEKVCFVFECSFCGWANGAQSMFIFRMLLMINDGYCLIMKHYDSISYHWKIMVDKSSMLQLSPVIDYLVLFNSSCISFVSLSIPKHHLLNFFNKFCKQIETKQLEIIKACQSIVYRYTVTCNLPADYIGTCR